MWAVLVVNEFFQIHRWFWKTRWDKQRWERRKVSSFCVLVGNLN